MSKRSTAFGASSGSQTVPAQAVAASVATKQAFSREQLVEISQWLLQAPKLTLTEIRQKTVDEEFFGTLEEVPDQSTLYRQLKRRGSKAVEEAEGAGWSQA